MNLNLSKFKLNYSAKLLGLSLAALSKFVAFSWVIGSVSTFFSAINVTGPLLVVFGGLPGGLLYLCFNWLVGFKVSWLFAHTGLPNLVAGLYWNANSKLIKLGLPVLGMGLFWYQTWGTTAAWYATLWFIPVLITCFNFNNLFTKALGATWMAHATGSVLWLYFGNINASVWVSIMPVALVERFCLAILMAGAYQFMQVILKQPSFDLIKNRARSLKRVL